MNYFLFSILITKFYQTNDNILYIPKNIKIYIEIPNGTHQFLDDYPILTIFKRTNITLNKQLPLDIEDKNILKNLMWTDDDINYLNEEKNMTYIEKKIYMNILYYLSSNKVEDKINYYEKIKKLAKSSTKCIYDKKIKKSEVSLKNKTKKEKENNILDFFDIKEEDIIKYDIPLIFKNKDEYIEINISDEEIKNKEINYFISNLKKVMSLEQSEEEIQNILGEYKITEDNYKKMMLILFRIFANIPVILMGETGCCKTELIKQLIKMLNKDEKYNNLVIKNIYSSTKENEIFEIIEKAENILEDSKNDFIYVFFDDINTTLLFSKMKEIFINHSFNGKQINERIRFIGACLPLRKKELKEIENDLKLQEEKIYLVNPLPNSLLNYILYFPNIDDYDTKKYIENIINEEFPIKEENGNNNNSFLRKIAIESIYDSHKFIKKINGTSSVSLRDIQKYKIIYKFLKEYYEYKKQFFKKNKEKLSDKFDIKAKIKSLVLSLYITYYIRIFKLGCNMNYIETINPYIKALADEFKINDWLDNNYWRQQSFRYIIKKEQDFLINEIGIKKEKGIGINTPLKENIFLMFISIYAHIPLIIVGKPGISKSLSVQYLLKKYLMNKMIHIS